MTKIDTGYDASTILETLLNTLIQKQVLSKDEVERIKESGKGATYRQLATGHEQTG